MSTLCLKIEKIKCNGCVNTILDNLNKQEGLSNLSGDAITKVIKFTIDEESRLEKILNILNEIGFPAKEWNEC